MNAKELETQHNLKKWAAIIKECRSSGMKIYQPTKPGSGYQPTTSGPSHPSTPPSGGTAVQDK